MLFNNKQDEKGRTPAKDLLPKRNTRIINYQVKLEFRTQKLKMNYLSTKNLSCARR